MRYTLFCWGLLVAGAMWPIDLAVHAQQPASAAAQHFEQQIAPLLRQRCLECHDSAAKKGKLDLSSKTAAFAGGENGPAIVPGKPDESSLWQQVKGDDMPQDREPLSKAEKKLLRDWIEQGAVWTVESIAPPRSPEKLVNWVQRLTVEEYIESVRVAVGVDIGEEARRMLPRDLRADGFSNTAYNLQVDLSHVEAYAKLAEIIAGRMDLERFASRFGNSRTLSKKDLRPLVAGMGKWVLRGPLSDTEVDSYLSIVDAVKAEKGDFKEAVRFLIEGMLQSPRFIYRIETQRGDGTSQPIGQYEMASRLSYMLWGAPPDEPLIEAADAGKLTDRDQVQAQVQRMLQDPRTIDRSSRFLEEWLNLSRLDHLQPNAELYPNWNPMLAADMRAETLAFFREVAWDQQRPLTDLLNAQVTYVTPRLAAHYDFPVPSAGNTAESNLSGDPRRFEALEALYTFAETDGTVVHDVSGRSDPLDLQIENESAVAWTPAGLTINAKTLISRAEPPRALVETLQRTKALTIEAWLHPHDDKQEGPARIVSLSAGTSNRNFTLGQEANRFDVRLRTSKTNANGMPSLASRAGAARSELTHVVYSREASGKAALYVNGEEQSSSKVEGDLANWDNSFRLTLANETSADRPWLGTLRVVALYSRTLSDEEIRDHREAGPWRPNLEPDRYDLSEIPHRGGLLTQASVLTIGGDHASMVSRGLFVLHELLHGEVKDPPPCVDTTPVPTKPGVSQRAIAEARLANRACGGCHAAFEPLAFGLERFDGLGTFRTVDRHGNKLRDDGEVLFPGAEHPVSYANSAELMDLLAGSERVREGIVRKVTQFALGRPLVEADGPALAEINAAAKRDGGTYAALMSAILTSDLVMKTRSESPSTGEAKP